MGMRILTNHNGKLRLVPQLFLCFDDRKVNFTVRRVIRHGVDLVGLVIVVYFVAREGALGVII